MRKSKITKELLADRLSKKKSHKEIADEVGLSVSAIRLWAVKHGLSKTKNKTTIGRKYASWKVIGKEGKNWICECDCGTIKKMTRLHSLTNSEKCRECAREIISAKQYKGVGGLSGSYYNSLKYGANKRKIEFNISKEFLWQLYLNQNMKCSITKVNIKLSPKEKNASLDRIDSDLGYIEGNVQWVHKKINVIKWNCSTREFIYWCQLVVKNNPKISLKNDEVLSLDYENKNFSKKVERRKKVAQIDPKTEEVIKIWDSAQDATIFLNNKKSARISNYCRGYTISLAYGYKWKYEEDLNKKVNI